MPKWHYLNEEDEMCWYRHKMLDVADELFTACHREAMTVHLHTEIKNQVTCLRCLKNLNREEANHVSRMA